MSKYDDFGEFMNNVIKEADVLCQRRYGCSLAESYHVSENTTSMIGIILRNGWWLLPCLVALLVLGKFGFLASLLVFCASGAGLVIVGLLAGFGGIAAIRYLYKERVFPIAVKEVGDKYRAQFEAHKNNREYINDLTARAVEDLIFKSKENIIR